MRVHHRDIYDEGELFVVLLQEDKQDREESRVNHMVLEIQSTYIMNWLRPIGCSVPWRALSSSHATGWFRTTSSLVCGCRCQRCDLRTLGVIQGSPRGCRRDSGARQR